MNNDDGFPTKIIAYLVICLILALLAVYGAYAHQAVSGWTYPAECCSGRGDCAMIPAKAVKVTPTHYIVTVTKGMHATRPDIEKTFEIPVGSVTIRRSGDGAWHICISPWGDYLCLYEPPGVS